MAMLRSVFGGCVSDRSSEAMRQKKLKFGAPLSTALKNGYIPIPLMELLVYISHEGMYTADLFRRPGNPGDTRRIVKRMSEGKPVIFQNYNLYTLTSVVKKFLLRIPGGIFGEQGEETLLSVLTLKHKMEQYEAVHEYIVTLSRGHQQLVSLLYGIWFTMINNSDKNFMTLEALSRSVAGSMFHSCATHPANVEKASKIMQVLIENFGVASMFGQENIEFFAETTRTSIHIKEKFRYEFQYPPDLPPITEEGFYEQREHEHEPSETPENSPEVKHRQCLSVNMEDDQASGSSRLMATSTISAPEVSLVPSPGLIGKQRPKSLEDNLNETEEPTQPRPSLSRFNSVKRKQLERLRQRSDWFLGPNASNQASSSSQNTCSHSFYGSHLSHSHERLKEITSGTSVTKASSEGMALDILSSDADSVFSDRSESPASEPVRTPPITVTRDIIHSDTITDAALASRDVNMEDVTTEVYDKPRADMPDTEVCYFVVEHKYGGDPAS